MTKLGDKQQLKIAIDTVRNPALGYFLGGMTASQARKLLKTKYKYSDSKNKKIAK